MRRELSYLREAVSDSLYLNNIYKDEKIMAILLLSLETYITLLIKKVKKFSEISLRQNAISLDLISSMGKFELERLLSFITISKNSGKSTGVIIASKENKKASLLSDHSYRCTKTKGYRFDDLFTNRKKRSIQSQQIESSLDNLYPKRFFNYEE
jgi:hypothetical protein